jgi:benzoyl-CoA reductase subunit A
MKCYVGIDLGSTTTKSVVLDAEGRVIGRGITNSRSNYEVACDVARREAFHSVRFALCARALEERQMDPAVRQALMDSLTRGFRLAQHKAQLLALRECLTEEAPHVESFHAGRDIQGPVREIMAAMEALAEPLFAPGTIIKSDFFRDIAASQYAALARERSCPERRPFEALLSVFDKAILRTENRILEPDFASGAGRAITQALAGSALSANAAADIQQALYDVFAVPLDVIDSAGTGYGRARLPFEKRQIRSEILCHGLGAHHMFPNTRTVLDIGGQDTKAIQVDDAGLVRMFQMNDRCAAGCGRYLGYIADEMNLGLHELGPLAQQSKAPVKINSTCTVFAGAEIRDRLTLGQKREDILAGLHRAVMLRAMSLLARSGGIHDEFTFTGGVARNETAVAVLRKLVAQNYGQRTLNISPDSIYTGALGAALFALRDAPAEVSA